MPLTLSAKFKVLQNQNYYGYHITGGKLFCTSVINSNFSLTRIVIGAKFLANGYIKCNFMCSDYELLDMESDMFNYCIISNIHLERSSLAWVRMEDCSCHWHVMEGKLYYRGKIYPVQFLAQ